jgi:hypothetical protein
VKAVILAATMSACLAAQPGSIQGVVVDETTGTPLAHVHVSLTQFSDGRSDSYGALSGAEGRFSIVNMPPGRYFLLAERTGFVQPAEVRVILKEGRELAALKVKMARASMLSGRVVDSYGDPVARMNVQMIPVPPARLSPSLAQGAYTQTDDRGEFRILTGPGKYYLDAEPVSQAKNGPPEVRSDGTSEIVYGTTYYRGATSKERASVVEAVAGRDVEGLEIHLAPLTAQRLLSVSGVITGMPPQPFVFMQVTPTGGDGRMMPSSAHPAPDGKFSVSGLMPGAYQVIAVTPGTKKPLMGLARFTLDAADVTGLEVAMHEAGEIAGTLQMAGPPSTARKIKLVPENGFPFLGNNSPSGDVTADGSFHIGAVWPGKYELSVDPLPETGYVKAVELDGASVPIDGLEIESGHVPRLKIALALDGAAVSGKVVDPDGDIADDGVYVYLMQDSDRVQQSVSAESGKYAFRGIRPGKYRLAAWPAGEEFDLAKVFAAGEEIELRPGDRVEKDLKARDANQ